MAAADPAKGVPDNDRRDDLANRTRLTPAMTARPTKVQPRAALAISSRQDDICDQVRAMIESGALKPGERVNEQALAVELRVGRSTAREALRALERTGLVRIVPNRGAEVRKVSLEEALDLYDLRSGLARVAGRLIAARLAPTSEDELQSMISRMEDALHARDVVAYADLNGHFHRLLMKSTRNQRLIETNEAVESALNLYLRDGVYSIAQMHESHKEHCRIFDAVRSGRVSDAAEAFESHILTGKQRMLDTVTRGPTTWAR